MLKSWDQSGQGGLEFAQGEAGDGGVLVVAADAGDQLARDAGDERVGGALGEGADFLVGRRDGDPVVELEAEQPRVPGFEDLLQARGGFDAQRSFKGQEQQVFQGLQPIQVLRDLQAYEGIRDQKGPQQIQGLLDLLGLKAQLQDILAQLVKQDLLE